MNGDLGVVRPTEPGRSSGPFLRAVTATECWLAVESFTLHTAWLRRVELPQVLVGWIT